MNAKQLRMTLREAVRAALVAEAKRKKDAEADRVLDIPGGCKASKPLDFSKPLGSKNVIKAAGAANFGPYTGENVLRRMVSAIIREEILAAKKIGRR